MHYKIWRARLSSPSAVGDKPTCHFSKFFLASPFGEPDLTRQDMARPKVSGRHMPSCKRAKEIIINEDAAASNAKVIRLPTTGGKGMAPTNASLEVSSNSEGVYVTHLTTSESEGEHQDPQAITFEPEDDQMLLAQRAELRSKRIHDLSRIRYLRLLLLLQFQIRLWSRQHLHKVREFYTAYGVLVPQGKKKAATFKPVDYVVVRGKKVKCDSDDNNAVLECTDNIADDY
uniref:Uncharacterized protein n=1 Tax=Solanum tuberosum TaxID=4113 RepID=M1DIA6_SOLTU